MQMSTNDRTILVGDDEMEVRGYLEMALKCLGYSVELASDGDEVLSCLQSSRSEIAAVLLDILMPNRDGIDTLREIRRQDPTLPVIIVSGTAATLSVVTAMKAGATDFLCKPVAHDDLRKAVTRALGMRGMNYIPPSCSIVPTTKTFLSKNPRMQEIHDLLGQIGWSGAPVLIQGETGTGKEVIARELHALSPRASKPFLKLNCAALPSELVESELFGYERGAFTGAFQKKVGVFELANGGTILLDEIGDMDVRLQAKLLQVLQDNEFHRIGGKETIKVDVRVMAATHCDLENAIGEFTFREDLYYRLNVINLVLPPLRERREDIVPLTEFLLKKHSLQRVPIPPISLDLKHAMINHYWPGNVRELENLVRKILIIGDTLTLTSELQAKTARKPLMMASSLCEAYDTAAAVAVGDTSASILDQVTQAKQQAEADAILAALSATRWNRKQAATLLKIDYKALLYKMKKLRVEDRTLPSARASQLSKAAGTGGS
jgi:two-component system response regulator AtoC